MVEAKKHILTSQGMQALEDELQDLKVVKRKEIAQKIKEAREQGDLSENAEYDAAKDEQRDIEARIEQIEKILKNAEVVVEDEVDLDKISVGCVVKVLDVDKYVTLGEYKWLEVSVDTVEVDDDEWDTLVNNVYYENITAENGGIMDRAVETGDTVNIDYEGKKDDVAFDGGTAQGYDLTIGSGSFFAWFED